MLRTLLEDISQDLEKTISGWFNDEIDGVLSRFLPSENPQRFVTRVIKTIKKIVPKLGKFLGKGDMGFVWATEEGVVKLTIDKTEAQAAAKLAGIKHPNVAAHASVTQIDDLPIYVIKQEYAGDPVRNQVVKRALKNLPFGDHDQLVGYLDQLYRRTGNNAFEQLSDGMNWLKANGVLFSDLSLGNVMEKDGIYKIIDIGIAKVKKPPEMTKQELVEYKLSLILSNIPRIRLEPA